MRPFEPWMYSDVGCSWRETYNYAGHYEMWDVLLYHVMFRHLVYFLLWCFVTLCFESWDTM